MFYPLNLSVLILPMTCLHVNASINVYEIMVIFFSDALCFMHPLFITYVFYKYIAQISIERIFNLNLWRLFSVPSFAFVFYFPSKLSSTYNPPFLIVIRKDVMK